MAEKKDGCVTPVKGPIIAAAAESAVRPVFEKEVSIVQAKVGHPAPDFELTASTGPNQHPISIAKGPEAGSIGDFLQFNASASYDPEGNSLSYLWDFGDGATSLLLSR